MPAAITAYTTYADIRAALGVSEDDIENATLGLTTYADLLEVELTDINLDLPTTYATIAALPTPTAVQARFLQAVRLFSTFAVAKHLTASLPLFAAKQVSDGKALNSRFDMPYKDTIKSVLEQYDRFKNRLTASLAAIGSTTTVSTKQVFFSVVSPASDPITGV